MLINLISIKFLKGPDKTLTGQSRKIVFNIFNYFTCSNNSDGGARMKDLYGLTSGVSKRIVQRVVSEVRKSGC